MPNKASTFWKNIGKSDPVLYANMNQLHPFYPWTKTKPKNAPANPSAMLRPNPSVNAHTGDTKQKAINLVAEQKRSVVSSLDIPRHIRRKKCFRYNKCLGSKYQTSGGVWLSREPTATWNQEQLLPSENRRPFASPKEKHGSLVGGSTPPTWTICSSNWIMKPQFSGWT